MPMPFVKPVSRPLNTVSEAPPVVTGAAGLRASLRAARARGERIALVPTMGNLHRGHLQLVRLAATRAERIVVSIFVNPLQFGPSEDFARYPRTLQADLKALQELGLPVLVFAPETDVFYPDGPELASRVEVGGLSEILCGASRPGHFTGVATVVLKLFNLVQPDVAVFGRKDYQQLQVIRRMVRDLDVPVDIVSGETVREPDGLALSSRNAFLDAGQRRQATSLHATLQALAEALVRGDAAIDELEQRGWRELEKAGLQPDYVSIRRQRDLGGAGTADRELVVLAAARLGTTRLIDNIEIRRD